MKRGIVIAGFLLLLSLLLVSLVHADEVSITPVTGNDVLSASPGNSGAENGISNQGGHGGNSLNISNITKEKNRVRFTENKSQCPDACLCEGSIVRCEFENGTRVMSVYAGNSGNIIVQVSGENLTTNVTLYKSGEKIYGTFAGNKTEEVRMFPDQVKERIRERINANITNENITLDENGTYWYEAEKDSRLFFIFPVKEKVLAMVDAENGTVTGLNSPWWSFLAKDVPAQAVVGASCGTVTPGQNDQCCSTKGYDLWNSTSSECEFNLSQ